MSDGAKKYRILIVDDESEAAAYHAASLEAAMRTIEGSARSMGIEVEG